MSNCLGAKCCKSHVFGATFWAQFLYFCFLQQWQVPHGRKLFWRSAWLNLQTYNRLSSIQTQTFLNCHEIPPRGVVHYQLICGQLICQIRECVGIHFNLWGFLSLSWIVWTTITTRRRELLWYRLFGHKGFAFPWPGRRLEVQKPIERKTPLKGKIPGKLKSDISREWKGHNLKEKWTFGKN